MKSIFFFLFESSPDQRLKKIANELYWFNEGVEQRKKFERQLPKFPPTYEVPDHLKNKN